MWVLSSGSPWISKGPEHSETGETSPGGLTMRSPRTTLVCNLYDVTNRILRDDRKGLPFESDLKDPDV